MSDPLHEGGLQYLQAICTSCGKPLNEDERFYYETSCNACEVLWMERIESWRHGGEDIQLDEVFEP